MDLYSWLKAGHVFAWAVWMAMLLIVPVAAGAVVGHSQGTTVLVTLRRLYSRVGTPAMLSALALGLGLAQLTGSFSATWLQAKLVLVLALAGLHGAIAGTLRRIADTPSEARPQHLSRLSIASGLALLLIIIFAVVKPIQ